MNNKPRFAGLEWLRLSLGFFVMGCHTAHRYSQTGGVVVSQLPLARMYAY